MDQKEKTESRHIIRPGRQAHQTHTPKLQKHDRNPSFTKRQNPFFTKPITVLTKIAEIKERKNEEIKKQCAITTKNPGRNVTQNPFSDLLEITVSKKCMQNPFSNP